MSTPGVTRKVWDFNLGIGGPILNDRLWYYANLRDEGSERTVPGMFANKNAGDPTKWIYDADTTRPAVLAASYRITALRLTAQATPRHKFSVFYDRAAAVRRRCRAGIHRQCLPQNAADNEIFAGSTAAPTPSASRHRRARDRGLPRITGTVSRRRSGRARSATGCWSRRASACIAAATAVRQVPGLETENLIRVVEQCTQRMRQQRRHRRPELSVAELVLERELEQPVERGGVVRDGHATASSSAIRVC